MTPELKEIIKAGDVAAAQPYIEEVIRALAADRWLAHKTLFAHRHTVPPAEFHEELVADFWSSQQYSQRMAFRGSAKSTLGEEDIALAALYVMFHNILIIGASETRAAERLASISYELENNDLIELLFGRQKVPRGQWTQTKIVTTRQVCIQAMGRDQDIRGIKFLDYRPDFVFVDDFEDKGSILTPEGRTKTLRWFIGELLPACAPHVKVRIRATPMDVESVPMRLMNESKWPTKIYPVEYRDPETGARRAGWPHPALPGEQFGAFTIPWIDKQRKIYESLGELAVWNREYMCEAVSDADRVFQKDMIRVEPRERSWQAVYAMIDPARTVRGSSASTGWAVWSWMKNRLVVWGAGAGLLLPDEIVALAFDIAERFDPVWIGVEQDGLEEFLMQPLRHEQARRGVTIPVKGLRAPRGKLDFIRGLQPFFAAREAVFAQPLPDLEAQLLNFPTGRIDAPNALAYALQMRPAAPVYDGFSEEHIAEGILPFAGQRLELAVNATGAVTTAVLAQHHDGILRILADWVFEGGPAERVADIAAAANLAASGERWRRVAPERSWKAMLNAAAPDRVVLRHEPPAWTVPPHHSDRYTNVGLMQAIRHLPAELRAGGEEHKGVIYIRDALARSVRGMPAVEISANAKWTLRALAGGYSRQMVRGRLQEFAEEGPYRVLMEGLESFCAMVGARAPAQEDDDNDQNYRVEERTGVRYASAMPQRRAR